MKKVFENKKMRIALLSLTAVLVCAVGAGTLALLVSREDTLVNTFKVGNVTTEIEEQFEQIPNEQFKFKKEPVVTNTGENECYVRVRVTKSPQEALEITGWDANWEQKGEYYYYKNSLNTGESTTPLFTTVSVKEAYQDTIEGFEVSVYQEAVQARMSAKDGSETTDAAVIWQVYDNQAMPENFQN